MSASNRPYQIAPLLQIRILWLAFFNSVWIYMLMAYFITAEQENSSDATAMGLPLWVFYIGALFLAVLPSKITTLVDQKNPVDRTLPDSQQLEKIYERLRSKTIITLVLYDGIAILGFILAFSGHLEAGYVLIGIGLVLIAARFLKKILDNRKLLDNRTVPEIS